MIRQGDTFYGGGAATRGEDHLWVVINDPASHSGVGLFVNITSQKTWSDITCVLQKADHPRIIRPSVVYYAMARAVAIATFERLIPPNGSQFTADTPVGAPLLLRIRNGALQSPHFPPELLSYL